MSAGCKGGACCVLACRKIRKRKSDGSRSSSEGSDDDESPTKKQYPRTFHRSEICRYVVKSKAGSELTPNIISVHHTSPNPLHPTPPYCTGKKSYKSHSMIT